MMKLDKIGASTGNGEGITIYAYNKGQITIPTKTDVYGSASKTHLIPEKPNTSYTYKYRIVQDDLLALDQPDRRCHEDSRELSSVSKCIAEYFEATYNCSFYMIDSPGGRADCMESPWHNMTDDIIPMARDYLQEWPMKTELEIYKTTGCMPSCKKKQIRLETEEEIKRYELNKENAKIQLMFHFRDGMYNLNEEYLVYDYNNFIADIGGYLGLLLGHSILSVYTMSADLITKPLRNIQNWLCPANKTKKRKAAAAKNRKRHKPGPIRIVLIVLI